MNIRKQEEQFKGVYTTTTYLKMEKMFLCLFEKFHKKMTTLAKQFPLSEI